jgi:hypothetical protein
MIAPEQDTLSPNEIVDAVEVHVPLVVRAPVQGLLPKYVSSVSVFVRVPLLTRFMVSVPVVWGNSNKLYKSLVLQLPTNKLLEPHDLHVHVPPEQEQSVPGGEPLTPGTSTHVPEHANPFTGSPQY